MRFWWVNHKATFRQEIDGGFLWSPKREKNARSHFYDNMRRVVQGDLMLSYAHGQLAHVGVATDPAVDAPRPHAFGATGEAWAISGWILPVVWTPLPSSVRPRDFWDELRPLLPQERYSPIVLATGFGNQKAYLSEIDEAAFDLVLSRAGGVRPETARSSHLGELLDAIEDEIEDELRNSDDTERDQTIKARRGQGRFRANVCEIDPACRLTGVDEPALLVASHIKPWRACVDARERLDGANGLMLTPNADRLFDRGLMTFEDDGEAIFAPIVTEAHLRRLGLSGEHRRKAFGFAARQLPYLHYHRAMFHRPDDGA